MNAHLSEVKSNAKDAAEIKWCKTPVTSDQCQDQGFFKSRVTVYNSPISRTFKQESWEKRGRQISQSLIYPRDFQLEDSVNTK